MIKPLTLYEQYSREEVYNIFDGVTPFSTGSGTWGIHGIVKIPKREKDFVFFVTFGQKQLGHEFDESITEDGILTWQSQPKHTLNHDRIKQFIHHNHLEDNIYLFLRTKKNNSLTKKVEPFTFLGRLAYVSHDIIREQPVYFKWQILDWEIPPSNILTTMDLNLDSLLAQEEGIIKDYLVETESPKRTQETIRETRNFYAAKPDYAENGKRNAELGLKGELLVLYYLRDTLKYEVKHTSIIEGDGAGYDIEAITEDGSSLYIEVKTTKGGMNTPFIVTANELAFSSKYACNYELYRVYEYDHSSNSGKFFKVEGDLKDSLHLNPTTYRANL